MSWRYWSNALETGVRKKLLAFVVRTWVIHASSVGLRSLSKGGVAINAPK